MMEVTFGTPSHNNKVQTEGGSYTPIFLDGGRIGYIEKYMAFGWKPFVGAYIVWGLEPNGDTTSERWFNTYGTYGDVYPNNRAALTAAKRYARKTLPISRTRISEAQADTEVLV